MMLNAYHEISVENRWEIFSEEIRVNFSSTKRELFVRAQLNAADILRFTDSCHVFAGTDEKPENVKQGGFSKKSCTSLG